VTRIDPASSGHQADLDRLHAVGSFFAGSPERILSIVGGLQQDTHVVQSRVQGPSMGATLPDGASIRIQLSRAPDCRPGEVVACLIGARLVTHRIVHGGGRSARVLITRGDDELLPDPPIDARGIVGRVVAVESSGQWVSPPPPVPDSAARRALAYGILAVVASLSRVNVSWARRALATLARWRDRLYPLRGWIGARRPTTPTR
jgi:hypothetical protein